MYRLCMVVCVYGVVFHGVFLLAYVVIELGFGISIGSLLLRDAMLSRGLVLVSCRRVINGYMYM